MTMLFFYALAVTCLVAIVLWVEDRISPFCGNALDRGLLALEEWRCRQLDRRWSAQLAAAQE